MKLKRICAAMLAVMMLTSCSLQQSDDDDDDDRERTSSSQREDSSDDDDSTDEQEGSSEDESADDESSSESEFTDNYTELGKRLCEDMAGGNFKTTAELCTDEVKAQLDEQKLTDAWAQIEGAVGKYRETLFARSQLAEDGITTVVVTTKFDKMKIDVKFGVNGEGKLVGMFFAPSDEPIDPEETDSYYEEAVKIGDLQLEGMVTIPKNVYKPTIVVLVQGSGQNGMNEGTTFYELAHGLAERGVAVLRYNKRLYQYPELEDFGDCTLTGKNGSTNYFRVDWFNPDGLRTWGDGRTFILGTEGFIEIPAWEVVAKDKRAYAEAFKVQYDQQDPVRGSRRLLLRLQSFMRRCDGCKTLGRHQGKGERIQVRVARPCGDAGGLHF